MLLQVDIAFVGFTWGVMATHQHIQEQLKLICPTLVLKVTLRSAFSLPRLLKSWLKRRHCRRHSCEKTNSDPEAPPSLLARELRGAPILFRKVMVGSWEDMERQGLQHIKLIKLVELGDLIMGFELI